MTFARIKLDGDHSAYHCGSAAAFRAIKAEVAMHGMIVGNAEDYDILVVNGEGSMHHDSAGCRRKVANIDQALRDGKRAMLVNTVWQDNAQQLADTLKRCDGVIVREIHSQRALADQGVVAELALDQSYYDIVDEQASYVDFDNKPVITDFYSNDFKCFARLNSDWARQFNYIDMKAFTWSSLIKSLRTASVLITGRHHAVYAACRARLPFLAMRGNTHKNEGLMATAGVNVPIFDNLADIRTALTEGYFSSTEYVRLFDWMDRQPKWTMFPR